LASIQTAVDVSSDWTKFPRFGFVSDYPKMSAAAIRSELQRLNDYHIDGLQFYDWQWKHHVPLAGTVNHPAPSWQDIAGRTNNRQTILDMIQIGHQLGMKAFNYNLLYGAWSDFHSDGSGVKPAWGLYADPGATSQVSFAMPSGWNTEAIDVFNPGNLEWRRYILNQEARVFTAYPFDGWQVDQLGNQGFVYDAKGNPVDLERTFAPFLNAAVETLHRQVIFNNVGGFGLEPVVSGSKESVAYVECWPSSGQVTYSDLKNTIDQVNLFSHGTKSTVLAAYLDSDYAQRFSTQHPGTFNPAGVLLTDATIFASGGDHIELGDNLYMLNAPYFPNHNLVMSPALKRQLLSYYNFLVAYENLLRGGLKETHRSLSLRGIATSEDGMPRTVWAFTKGNNQYDVIHLINLYGQKTSLWQDSEATSSVPPTLKSIHVKYYVGKSKIKGVWLASPDDNQDQSVSLSFQTGHDARGNYIAFTIPKLQYWDMVYMK
jgi:dextranase